MHINIQLSNSKLSQERWFLIFVYYTDLCTRLYQFYTFYNHKKIIFQSHVSDLNQYIYIYIYIYIWSTFSRCYTGLGGAGCSTKGVITASFVENFTENLGNTTWVSFTVVIKILRVKQILRANRNSYFYIGNIAKMLTASPNNGVTV